MRVFLLLELHCKMCRITHVEMYGKKSGCQVALKAVDKLGQLVTRLDDLNFKNVSHQAALA